MIPVFGETVIGKVRLRNRIIRSATCEGLADQSGVPTDRQLELYTRLAEGGAGAIIAGYTAVSKQGQGHSRMCMLDKDELVDRFRPLVDTVRSGGAALILQLVHCGAMVDAAVTGSDPVAPSSLLNAITRKKARAMSDADIEETINHFSNAIERAKRAGFDGVQLHAAHGYLLSEFLSPGHNRRTDRWGGGTENRCRIVTEIVRRARNHVGDYPLWIKMNGSDGDRNGLRLDEAVRIAKQCEACGIDAIEVSCGSGTDGFNSVRVSKPVVPAMLAMLPSLRKLGPVRKALVKLLLSRSIRDHRPLVNYNVDAAEQIKKNVTVPVFAVGGIRTLDDIEAIIDAGKADCVSLCRPFVIEPDIVAKFASGNQRRSRCCDCGYCLLGLFQGSLRCYGGNLPKG